MEASDRGRDVKVIRREEKENEELHVGVQWKLLTRFVGKIN